MAARCALSRAHGRRDTYRVLVSLCFPARRAARLGARRAVRTQRVECNAHRYSHRSLYSALVSMRRRRAAHQCATSRCHRAPLLAAAASLAARKWAGPRSPYAAGGLPAANAAAAQRGEARLGQPGSQTPRPRVRARPPRARCARSVHRLRAHGARLEAKGARDAAGACTVDAQHAAVSSLQRGRLRLERRVCVQAQLAQCGFSCAAGPSGRASALGEAQKRGAVTASPASAL